MRKARTGAGLAVILAGVLGLADVAAAEAPRSIEPLARSSGPNPVGGRYPSEMVVKGPPGFDGSFSFTPIYRGAAGQPLVQVWESAAGVLKTDAYPFDEYCLVLEGEVEVTNPDGARRTFRPGDTFVIPKGWRGVWDMKTRFKKHSIILSSPDEASAAALRQLMK